MKTNYPILLVHGMGFRDSRTLNYWGRIPAVLEENGNKIYYGNQDAVGSIRDNALVIKNRIEEIVHETDCGKVNIIAHSKGGLDVRYAMSHYNLGDKVASITTIQTPHNGSKTVDLLLKFPDWMVKLVGFVADIWMRMIGDKNPDSYNVYHAFSTKEAEKFNNECRDDERVYCQSYAFIMNSMTSDIFMIFPHIVVNLVEGENDGLLAPDSVKWGNFKGIYKGNTNRGISHCDEVDLRRRRFSNKEGKGIKDITGFY